MPFAAFDAARLAIASGIVFLLSAIDFSRFGEFALELFLFGRIPGTAVTISFEAFFLGAIVAAWAIATYNFTAAALIRINKYLGEVQLSQKDIEEVAL